MRTSFEGVSIFSSRFRRVLFTRTITTNATTSSLDEAFPVPQRIRLGKRGEDSTDIRRQNKRKEPYYSNSGNVEENTTFESKTNQGKSNFHFNSDQYTERSPFNTRKDDRTRFERLFHKSTSRPPFNSGPIIIEPPSDMPAFYTGRPEYYQALAFLDSLLAAASLSQSPLTIAQIDEWAQQQYSVVSNKHKRTMKNAVVMGQDNYWQDQIKMSYTMGFPLSLQEYYFVLSRLNALKAIVTANSSTISGTSGLISLPVFLEGFVKKGIDETVGNTTGDPLLKKA